MSHAARSKSGELPAWFFAYAPFNIANGATSALLPLYMVIVLGATVLEVGVLFFITALAAVPSAFFWGRYSDKLHRRRPFVLIGLASFAVTLPVMAVSRDMTVYLAANALLGLMQAAAAATSTVLIMEQNARKAWPREIGLFAQVSGVAFVGGLALGAVWFTVGPPLLGQIVSFEALFFLAAGLSAISVGLGAATLKEGRHKVDRTAAIEALAHLGHSIVEKRRVFLVRFTHISALSWKGMREAARRPIGAYCLGIALLFTGFLVFNAPLPVFLLQEARFSQDLIAWIYLANAALAAALYGFAGSRLQKRSPRRYLLGAAGSRIAIYPAFALTVLALGSGSPAALLLIVALNALAGASWAFINVASSVLASHVAPADAKGEAMGLYNAAIGVGSIVGSLLGGALAAALPYTLVFASASGFIAIGTLVVYAAVVAPSEEVPGAKSAPEGRALPQKG